MGLDFKMGGTPYLNFEVVMTYNRAYIYGRRGIRAQKNNHRLSDVGPYSIQKGGRLNRCHYIKGNQLLSKHAFIEICEFHKGP